MTDNSTIYFLNDVLDVYIKDLEKNTKYIQFYFINTRRKIGISGAPIIVELIREFSEGMSLHAVKKYYLEKSNEQELIQLLDFLALNQIIVPDPGQATVPASFEKEALFVNEWVGGEKAIFPLDKKVLIVGCGSVGGAIAEILVRGGVNDLGLLDFKVLSESDSVRHVHYDSSLHGLHKAEVLQRYISGIREGVNISKLDMKITPHSKIDDVFDRDYDLVVNTADEPYIGYTSILLGRWARERKIPLCVAGGFDAHLFSTGDFYETSIGDCVECATDFFSESLKSWKPTYFINEPIRSIEGDDMVLGGAGGNLAGTLFSASYAAMNILSFLHGGTQWRGCQHRRGEYNNVSGLMSWVDIHSELECTHHE